MYDAVRLFATALHDLDRSQAINIRPLSCESEEPWPYVCITIWKMYFHYYLGQRLYMYLYFSSLSCWPQTTGYHADQLYEDGEYWCVTRERESEKVGTDKKIEAIQSIPMSAWNAKSVKNNNKLRLKMAWISCVALFSWESSKPWSWNKIVKSIQSLSAMLHVYVAYSTRRGRRSPLLAQETANLLQQYRFFRSNWESSFLLNPPPWKNTMTYIYSFAPCQ